MEDKKILLDNIDKIHTTEMGIDRIINNNSDYLQKARKYGHFTGYKN